MEKIDESFNKLKKDAKNDVDHLVKWMKDSKLVESTVEAEEKARKMFEDCKDKTNVELEKFKEVVTTLAEEQKKSIDEFSKMLHEEGPKFMDAIKAGATSAFSAGISAFKDCMKKS